MNETTDPCIQPFKMIERNLGLPKCFPKGSTLSRIKAFVRFKVDFGFPDDFYYVKEGTVRPVVQAWHRLQKLKSIEKPTEEQKKQIDVLQYFLDNGVTAIKEAIGNLSKECEVELEKAKTTVNEFEESLKRLNIDEKKLPKDKREEYKEAKKAMQLGIPQKREVLQKTVSQKLQEITTKIPSKNLPIDKNFETIPVTLRLTKEEYDRWVRTLCDEGNPPKDNKAFAEIIFSFVNQYCSEKKKGQ